MCKIIICTCFQCKAAKNKRKNKNVRKRVNRMLNKRRRKCLEDKVFNYYWA